MDCVTKCGSGAAMSLVPTVHDVYGDMVVILFDAAGRRPISQHLRLVLPHEGCEG
jgi:hypothetical protein